jgi:outer membrane murein-binding lipoprotein Lpp
LRNEELGSVWEEDTETQVVSRWGAGLHCRHLVLAESIVVIVRQDTGQRAKARVRYSRYNPDGKRELGIEFIENDNFWGLDWNSSEPIDSQPEEIRTPSGFTQVSEAIFLAGIGEENEQLKTQVAELQKENGQLVNNLQAVTAARDALAKENERLKARIKPRKTKRSKTNASS